MAPLGIRQPLDLSTDPAAYGAFDHEQLAIRRGERSGAIVIVAIHSTVLGPALGGARMWRYPTPEDGVVDALRLAAAMTLKASLAGLDLGGGKGVIALPADAEPSAAERDAILLDFADLVESLGGRYITAEDVGTGPDDMVRLATRTSHVVGLPGGSGDPSPVTAAGVAAAIRASIDHALPGGAAEPRIIAIPGLGRVGSNLARILTDDGHDLLVTDINPERRGFADEIGAEWIEPDEVTEVECEVLAPCALGGAITAENVDRLNCRIVCGGANNMLADRALAERLAERGILYAPDFVANAGGLISVYGELHGYPHDQALELAAGIGPTMTRIFDAAASAETTPLAAARGVALERVAAAAGPEAA